MACAHQNLEQGLRFVRKHLLINYSALYQARSESPTCRDACRYNSQRPYHLNPRTRTTKDNQANNRHMTVTATAIPNSLEVFNSVHPKRANLFLKSATSLA